MIIFHGVLGLIALVMGALILLLKQGTRLHKRIGKVYVAAIYLLCFTSFFILEFLEDLYGNKIFMSQES